MKDEYRDENKTDTFIYLLAMVSYVMDVANAGLDSDSIMDIIPLEVSYKDQLKVYILQCGVYVCIIITNL